MRSPRLLIALTIACSSGSILPGPAGAQTGMGGVAVSPASIDVQVRAGTRLPAIRVGNDTGRNLDIRAVVVPASQELSGLPVFDLGVRSRRAGRALARVSPERFTVKAGSTRSVSVRVVGARPLVGTGSYGVVVFEALPSVADGGTAGSVVASRLRLTSNLLLRYPAAAAARRTASILSMRAEQASLTPKRTLRFVGRVANTGRIHVQPRSVLRIRNAAGELVSRATLPGGNVLPGAQREFPVVVRKLLPAGDYEAVIATRGGRRSTRAWMPFTLVAPNTLPTPNLRVGALAPPDDATNEEVRARLEVVNRGTATGRPVGEAILATTGGRVLARRPLRMASIPAGERGIADLRLPGVANGPHRLTVILRDGDRTLDTRTVVFTPGTAPGWWTRALDWCAAHVPLLLAAFGVVLLLVLVGVTVYVQRLRSRLVGVRPPT